MQVKQDIKRIFPAPDIDSSFVHLGHPLVLPSKDRSAAYNFVYDKFKSKLSTYKANRLSHAARLTLIKSVFSSIPVYYMSNILFSKKFLAKLTTIIRNFWWTGIQDDQTTKSLCLRAWADVCIEKKIGGLGVRNLQAINQGLILSTAWILAKEPQSQLALILKAKYHHDTSIWRARPNKPKSAFWSAILKVKPLLISATICQIVDGASSIWSLPWFFGWETIYDHFIIQQQSFSYPAQVKDLWIPGQKNWNANLINSLFTPELANTILKNPIIKANGKDMLVWKLTPAGEFSSISAYKHCFNNLQLPPRQRISLLNQVWEDKQMAPRVQTFAWRLLREALPTGKRASRYSKHINENCSRCGLLEDEMHMLFLCPFSKAAWFCYPWFIKTESLAENYHSIPDMIRALITSQHPKINLTTLYTFLWCL
uniref:Reverse transcriptase zinc-binding domain-containing protein n=1 Tax=Triticum urartu TaxID=4572 RepID=A0A8R7V1A6_TRIUA